MSSTQKRLLLSGVIQLIIGAFCMIFGIIEGLNGVVKDLDEKAYAPEGYFTLTSFTYTGAWFGLWILITGLLGIFAKLKSSSCLVRMYLGFTITSLVIAFFVLIFYCIINWIPQHGKKYSGYAMSVLIILLSAFELLIGITVCCWLTSFCLKMKTTTPEVGQVIYLQPQGSLSSVPYVIIQGPDGRPIAVPAETSDGPMTELNGTPTYSQTEAVPPRYSGPDDRPIAMPAETSGPMTELNDTPTYSQTEAVPPRYSTYC